MPAVPAMLVALPPVRPMLVDPVAMRHRPSALYAELGVLGMHACRDFRDVGYEFGTQSHRIGRASLAGLISALGRGAIDGNEKCADRQCQPADETHGPPHSSFPGSVGVVPGRHSLAARRAVVDGRKVRGQCNSPPLEATFLDWTSRFRGTVPWMLW